MILLTHLGMINTEVVRALPHPVSIVEIDRNDNSHYAETLELAWNYCRQFEEDFVNVEHDVVAHQDVWEAFEICPSMACAFAIWVGGSYAPGLGCVRFRYDLIDAYPEMMKDAASLCDDLLPARDWRRMDTRVWRTLKAQADIKPCIHVPPIKHLHRYPIPDPKEIG